MANGSAPGKIILFGEHAVVYGRPAIAGPVWQVRAEAAVQASPEATVRIDAPDVGRHFELSAARPEDAIASIIRLTCARLQVEPRAFDVHLHSTIPVARGLGSGAAISVAVVRALCDFFQYALSTEEVSALAYECEKLYHGTPSGIDNTVIAHARPVYYVRGEPFRTFEVARPFLIAIADTGIASPTRVAVGDVRRAWQAEPARYERLFDEVGAIAQAARRAIEQGEVRALGPLMEGNQALAREIGVSSPEIETLVNAALGAGALGAKLSGAGRGGNVIALIEPDERDRIEAALRRAGARDVIITEIKNREA